MMFRCSGCDLCDLEQHRRILFGIEQRNNGLVKCAARHQASKGNPTPRSHPRRGFRHPNCERHFYGLQLIPC